jgi:cytochrome c-type biogenesis protein CcmH/NrfG
MSEDINQEILKELQKTRRSNQVLLSVIGITLLVVTIAHQKPSATDHSWTAVQTAARQLDYPRALAMAQANVARQPSDYYGHSYLGYIYLAMGDVTNSEAEYSRAYQLFPSEDNEKDLTAVRKRLAAGGDFKLLSK